VRLPLRLFCEEVSRLADASVMAIGTADRLEKPGLRWRSRSGLLAVTLATGAWSQDAPPQVQAPQTVTDALLAEDPASSPAASGVAGPAGLGSRLRLHAYSDVDFSHNAAAGEPNHYSVDEIDLFGTAAIAPTLTALAEVVIDTGVTPSLSSVPLNVERLLLQYRANRYLQIEVGQFRTAIGYYSTAYLRGAWFQTSISRPRMFAFEEDGGILPLHTVGVSASGSIPSGRLGLHYVLESGNTRTWGSSAPNNVTGHDAVNFSLFARPASIPGLEAGFSAYHDRFSPFTGFTVDRSTFTAHLVYTANRIEFLNEGVLAHLHDGPVHATGTFAGFYSQLAYRVGPNWGPYVRVEKLTIHADPLFSALSVAPWRSMYTGGIRYDWNDHVAIKAEAGHEADWAAPPYYQAAMQVAFAF
jgi:hypothetical protein